VSNLLLYLAYLLITGIGIGHKLAMTILYVTGVCLTFVFNKNWTFSHRGQYRKTFIGYILIYLLGYLVNFSALYLFVDRLEFPHQLVQGVMILVIAVLMFLLQKFLLFTPPTHNNSSGSL
jgi:putative flippase GtrA